MGENNLTRLNRLLDAKETELASLLREIENLKDLIHAITMEEQEKDDIAAFNSQYGKFP